MKGTTSTTTNTTTMATTKTNFFPLSSLPCGIGHPTASPPPLGQTRWGVANNRSSNGIGETVARCGLKGQSGGCKSTRPSEPHRLMSQVPGERCGKPNMLPSECIAELRKKPNKSSREPCKSGGGFQLVSRTGCSPLNPGTARTPGRDHQDSIQKLQNRFEALQGSDGDGNKGAEDGTPEERSMADESHESEEDMKNNATLTANSTHIIGPSGLQCERSQHIWERNFEIGTSGIGQTHEQAKTDVS